MFTALLMQELPDTGQGACYVDMGQRIVMRLSPLSARLDQFRGR
ncbi:hypothetical protein ADG881_48 [Alcanivorax sp. DG881]|nr:hypothetical protein ADG881_48 [Alcanivorax sp. DG881]